MSTLETTVTFANEALRIHDIAAIAYRQANVKLANNTALADRIQASRAALEQMLADDVCIYGVNTGYGDSCTVNIPAQLRTQLPSNLVTYHGIGLGQPFTPQETRAILAARLASLCQGYSGVRWALLEGLTALLQHDVLPRIPCEGSVGASGDLTPLSYIAAVLMGEREVWHPSDANDQPAFIPAKQALQNHGLETLQLQPKEALAIMNGTAAMTGLACLALVRAEKLAHLVTRLTALASLALQGNSEHFDADLFAAKPHPGQGKVAQWLREDLQQQTHDDHPTTLRLQDRYSIRCAPHVIGVLVDALPMLTQFVETELNSANDNPLIFANPSRVRHGGHFYGGHIAFAMDSLKNLTANLADLLDRQIALMVDTRFNQGLPANLNGATGEAACLHHGLKALQITASACTAEALKLTMPASVFSRSTECHNQDKVSQGTLAARDAQRVLTLTEQVTALQARCVLQALALREREQPRLCETLSPACQAWLNSLRQGFPLLQADQSLEYDIHRLMHQLFFMG